MKHLFILLTFSALTLKSFGQSVDSRTKKPSLPLTVTFNTHAYSWPFVQSLVTPIQPGVKIGTEYVYSAGNAHMLLQSVNMGWFRNSDFLDAYCLNSYFTYRYTLPYQLFFDAGIGAGYLHRRHAREVFKLNDQGVYESKTDWGSSAVQVGLNLGAGYNFRVNQKQLSLLVNYEFFINYPHVKGDVPLLPHSLYHVGFRYYPFN